jgi:hypothetical protein
MESRSTTLLSDLEEIYRTEYSVSTWFNFYGVFFVTISGCVSLMSMDAAYLTQ